MKKFALHFISGWQNNKVNIIFIYAFLISHFSCFKMKAIDRPQLLLNFLFYRCISVFALTSIAAKNNLS